MDDISRARRFINDQKWIFAKTMAHIPHEYCLLKNNSSPEEFLWFVKYMTAHSEPGEFFGKTFHYYFQDGYKYWMMDPSPEECDLINREVVK